MKDRLHRGFKVSAYGLEYNEELSDEYDEKFEFFSMFRRHACRRVRRSLDRLQV